jgi:hypothetical protein
MSTEERVLSGSSRQARQDAETIQGHEELIDDF